MRNKRFLSGVEHCTRGNVRNWRKTRFQELGMSPRYGSAKPTPTPLTGEATKPRRNGKTRGKKGGLSLRDGKTVNENHRRVTSRGGRGEHVPTKTITNVPPPHTKGERAGRKWTSTDRTQKITVLCHSTSILLTQIAPGSERVEIGVNRMKNKKST